MMTKTDAEHLAEILHVIRDDWDQRGILAALQRIRTRDLASVVIAATRAASDDRNKTPAVIALQGPHWDPVVQQRTKAPPAMCPTCRWPHDREKPCDLRGRRGGEGRAKYQALRIQHFGARIQEKTDA